MSVWSARDLVVLRHLHERPPRDEVLSTNWQSKEPHAELAPLREVDVHVAVETLADEGLVSYSETSRDAAGGVLWTGFQVSGAGLQALGEWHVFATLTSPSELGDLLEALADVAPSDEEEGNLRKASSTVRLKTLRRCIASPPARSVPSRARNPGDAPGPVGERPFTEPRHRLGRRQTDIEASTRGYPNSATAGLK
jgi:hypothetical protein